VLFDGVFNHVGRDFWAFKDLQEKGKDSKYRDWFSNLDFSKKGNHGDGFTYDGWHGHYQLVEFNLKNKEVQAYLFSALAAWIDQYQIDGLRLDAADVIDLVFLKELTAFCKTKKSDFWLLGEVVFGDYREWAKEGMLDCVTNYEYHTPLNDSFNQRDFGHIARILRRQFGPKGIYRDITMYSFVDNHDVDRAASALLEPAHLFPLYLLLFTLPGIPAIYNGSEWGFEGKITNGKHDALRPEINPQNFDEQAKHPLLLDAIKQFTAMRKAKVCLQKGAYQELLVCKEQFVFIRAMNDDFVICIINASRHAVMLKIPIQDYTASHYIDILNKEHTCQVKEGFLYLEVPSWWGRVLAPLT
jgi:glycosidase